MTSGKKARRQRRTPAPPPVRSEADLRNFLDALEAQELLVYEGLSLESYNQWKGATHHQVAAFAGFANDITSRRDYAAVIDRWNGRVHDSTLARRLALHHRDFLLSRADPALASRLVDLQTAIQDTVGQP